MDPSTIRLSKHFLLSDFIGNHSVYAGLVTNEFVGNESHIDNGKLLCAEVLEPLVKRFGSVSISYGYISPEYSQKRVKYMDPTKPSHHRWDKGAAADVIFHKQDAQDVPPVEIAHEIDQISLFNYSRMITYSESPYICLAYEEKEKSRRAFYENRYQGVPKEKPKFIVKPASRLLAKSRLPDLSNWRGAGYPTHHGGGIRRAQHIRISKYTMLSDWLFSYEQVASGTSTYPILSPRNKSRFEHLGKHYDALIEALKVPRLSIVSGYHLGTTYDSWPAGGFKVSFVAPEYVDKSTFLRALFSTWPKEQIKVTYNEPKARFTILGEFAAADIS